MKSPVKETRQSFLAVLLVVFIAAAISHRPGQAAQSQPSSSRRRALLVGVNTYRQAPETGPSTEPGRGGAPGSGFRATTREFGDLRGPANDVELMREILTAKYGFTEIKVLKNQQATRESIIQAVRSHLIDEASPGDVCVFYYAGHGSRVRNSKDPKGWDESIVPADSTRGAPDIRDKEIARLFLKAIDKGVFLTAIFDSCHSGSIARGFPGAQRLTRTVAPNQTDVADPPDFIDTPEDKGALVLSASKDDQLAQEDFYGGQWHGDFTWALAEVLRQPAIDVNESSSRVFDRVVSIMKGRGAPEQPVLGGNAARRRGPLFSASSNEQFGAPTAAVVKLDGGVVTLKGGLAMGLNDNCEIIEAGAQPSMKPFRLRITRVSGLDGCEARIIAGLNSGRNIEPGMLFVLDRWAAPERLNLTVYVPPPLADAEMVRVRREVASIRGAGRVQLVDDPTKQVPTCVLQHDQKGWSLLRAGGRVDYLAHWPESGGLAALLSTGDALLVNVPPTAGLRKTIALGQGTKRELIRVSDSAVDAQYVLVGRIAGNDLEYAWLRPGVMIDDLQRREAALPARTDWCRLGENPADINLCVDKLEDRAVRLGRISGWLQIQAPASESEFPYKLALRRVGTGTPIKTDKGAQETLCFDLPEPLGSSQPVRKGEVLQGDCYDLVLAADAAILQEIKKRGLAVKRLWIYVFSIDSHGKSELLFPDNGSVENRFPINPAEPPPLITLNPKNARLSYEPPFGLDAYILLASDQELTNPDVLTSDGVVGRGAGGNSTLASLIDDINTGTRGGPTPAPLNWSIDRIFIRSVGKRK